MPISPVDQRRQQHKRCRDGQKDLRDKRLIEQGKGVAEYENENKEDHPHQQCTP